MDERSTSTANLAIVLRIICFQSTMLGELLEALFGSCVFSLGKYPNKDNCNKTQGDDHTDSDYVLGAI